MSNESETGIILHQIKLTKEMVELLNGKDGGWTKASKKDEAVEAKLEADDECHRLALGEGEAGEGREGHCDGEGGGVDGEDGGVGGRPGSVGQYGTRGGRGWRLEGRSR